MFLLNLITALFLGSAVRCFCFKNKILQQKYVASYSSRSSYTDWSNLLEEQSLPVVSSKSEGSRKFNLGRGQLKSICVSGDFALLLGIT